jgi:hypothetical protein
MLAQVLCSPPSLPIRRRLRFRLVFLDQVTLLPRLRKRRLMSVCQSFNHDGDVALVAVVVVESVERLDADGFRDATEHIRGEAGELPPGVEYSGEMRSASSSRLLDCVMVHLQTRRSHTFVRGHLLSEPPRCPFCC